MTIMIDIIGEGVAVGVGVGDASGPKSMKTPLNCTRSPPASNEQADPPPALNISWPSVEE